MLGLFGLFSKWIRIIGITFIILFSAVSILFSLITNVPDILGTYGDVLLYAKNFENKFFDYRYTKYLKTLKPTPSDHAVLAAIDDKSIFKIGRFPWSRDVWDDIVKKLEGYGAKVISFDVLFSEKEKACVGDPDSKFANQIKDFSYGAENIIIGYNITFNEKQAEKEIPPIMYNYLISVQSDGTSSIPPQLFDKMTFPIEKIQNVDAGLGFIVMRQDPDGVYRNYSVLENLVSVEDWDNYTHDMAMYFPSFGLITYQKLTGENIKYQTLSTSDGYLEFGKERLYINPYGQTKLRFRGGANAFNTISLVDILNAPEKDPEMIKAIKGKAVFIGSTAFAAHDIRNSPVDSSLPGVYFHMNFLDMLKEKRFFKPQDESLYITWAILIIGTLLILFVQRKGNALFDLLTVGTVVSSSYMYDYFYLLPRGYEIKLFFCLNNFIAIYMWDTFLSFYTTAKEKRKIRGAFSRYVAPSIVDQMLDNPDKLKMGGERKDITVFFSDVRDFTSISEKLTPTELSTCLNTYMNEMTQILFDSQGTLDKYIGDAIVGYWGAPVPVEHHAYLGVKASVEMIDALPALNEKFAEQGFPEFKVGIGLNTGICSVGNMGSDKIFSYTALGDHMNLGARLESSCKFYGAQIIISEYTLERFTEEQRAEFIIRDLDYVKVKGKEQPVKIYEVLHMEHPFKSDPYSLEMYQQAYKSFMNKEFDNVIDLLKPILEKYPEDKSTQRILYASQDFKVNPPPEDWDGVTVRTSK